MAQSTNIGEEKSGNQVAVDQIDLDHNDGDTRVKNDLSHLILNLIDPNDVVAIVDSQRNMLARYEKTNEMLVNCIALATNRFEFAQRSIKQGTQKLNEMRKDLDYIFKRTRIIKSKIAAQYPQAYQIVTKDLEVPQEDD
ncbi:kxDL motif-containing protein 1 [Brevipalpus obovatus]|uniref:kxDL motif-containing protein 1 n=1 Tax=Brevipalpus obovatus TaxID=246614 RepID=UPI003D9DCFAB